MAGQGLSRVDSSSLPINLDQYGVRKVNQGEWRTKVRFPDWRVAVSLPIHTTMALRKNCPELSPSGSVEERLNNAEHSTAAAECFECNPSLYHLVNGIGEKTFHVFKM